MLNMFNISDPTRDRTRTRTWSVHTMVHHPADDIRSYNVHRTVRRTVRPTVYHRVNATLVISFWFLQLLLQFAESPSRLSYTSSACFSHSRHQQEPPTIWNWAMQYLYIPVTSVPAEEFFRPSPNPYLSTLRTSVAWIREYFSFMGKTTKAMTA